MNKDKFKLSLSNFLGGESDDPFDAPPGFNMWVRDCAWAASLYEPELTAAAEARTTIVQEGKTRSVINLCSYNYLGLANRPEIIEAAHALRGSRKLPAAGAAQTREIDSNG